jgi:arylsulfatase A-like enzyme
MVTRMDDQVGRLLATHYRHGLADKKNEL